MKKKADEGKNNLGNRVSFGKREVYSRIVWIVSGFILGAAAILSFLSSGEKLLNIAPWLGTAMLVAGMLNIVLYFWILRGEPGAKWLLADGMTAALLSIFPMFNQISSVAIVPFYFCVWDLFSGILRVMESAEEREEGGSGWSWFFGVGILEILAGVAALVKPVEEALKMHVVIGLVLLVQAVAFFHKAGAGAAVVARRRKEKRKNEFE